MRKHALGKARRLGVRGFTGKARINPACIIRYTDVVNGAFGMRGLLATRSIDDGISYGILNRESATMQSEPAHRRRINPQDGLASRLVL